MQLFNILTFLLLTGGLSANTVKALECYKSICNSETDKGCINDPANLNVVQKCYPRDERCFTLEYHSNTIRGCESDIPEDCIAIPEECKTKYCNYFGCNKNISPKDEVPLKCIQCIGKNCISVSEEKPTVCDIYDEKDECYTFVVAKDNVIRGCLSDADSPCGTVACVTCRTDGCNNELYIEPEINLKCIQCSGKECVSVTDIEPTVCTHKDNEDECYTYAVTKDNVIRGCLSDEKSPCLDGSCITCKINGCNNELYRDPEPVLKCIQCIGQKCVSVQLEKPTVCQIHNKGDECYTFAIAENNVMRGCLSDTSSPCATVSCLTCKTDGCNNALYTDPKPTLKCFQCSGKNCATVAGKTPKICRNYKKLDECYTYVINEQNVIRGCISDEESRCDTDFCVTCKADGCNTDPAFTYFSCNVCQENSARCMGQTGKTGVCAVAIPKECKVLLGRRKGCFTYFKINDLVRGCREDFPDSFEKRFTTLCNTENCNSECVSNCYECSSKNDPKCRNQLNQLHRKACIGTGYCHECENKNGIVIRGCDKTENNTHQTCNNCQDNSFCNQNQPIDCITCSSEKDSACILIADILKMNHKKCDSIFDACISKINKTHTVRGCEKEVQPCSGPYSTTCKSCYADLCNTHLIPENRVVCHQCKDNKDCPKKQQLQNAKPCQYYSFETNKCFSVKERGQVIRGCASDKEHDICTKEGIECRYCNGIWGCNSDKFERSSKCIICNDRNKCGWTQNKDNAVECEVESMEHSCFTQIFGNQTVIRGCLNKDVCNDSKHECYVCKGNACNTKLAYKQTCIICDSTKNKNCIDGKGIASTLCTAELINFSNRGCYTTNDGDKIIRGCASDLPDKAIRDCENKDIKYCILCRGEACNNKKAYTEEKRTVKCIQCNDAEQCPWGFTEDSAKECDKFQTTCIRYQYENGSVIRECGDDKPICDPDDKKCQICHTNGCNKENVIFHKCYQCQSYKEEEASCSYKAENITAKKCSNLQTYEKRGCYTKIENKIVSRGCINDLEEMELVACKADRKKQKCNLCLESKCNNEKAPNGGSTLTHFSLIILVIMSALVTVKDKKGNV